MAISDPTASYFPYVARFRLASTTQREHKITHPIMMKSADEIPTPNERGTALPPAAVGAIVAFVRVAELYDPAVAHRSALRAIVADRLVAAFATAPSQNPRDREPLSSHWSVVVAVAAIRDLDLTVNRPAQSPSPSDLSSNTLSSSTLSLSAATPSLIGPTLVERIEGLDAVAAALELRHERFDGTGRPHGLSGSQIPLASRICAVADQLVGNPTAGFMPPWKDALRRAQAGDPGLLDPALLTALDSIELDDITAPLSASDTIQDLFDSITDEPRQDRLDSSTLDAGTDPSDEVAYSTHAIRTAISNAAKPREVIELLAQRARRNVDATEVVVMTSTTTQLNEAPLTRVHVGPEPELSLDRLDDIFEFSTQAELRAGVTIERSLSPSSEHGHCEVKPVEEVIVPISVDQDVWGLLIATRAPGLESFTSEHREALSVIAAEIGDIVSATNHWADMEEMALGDQLTGIGNRHRLYRVLDAVFERPPASRLDTALIMCDVDGLKVVNDTMGHHEGDRLLIDAAAALTGAVRNPETTTVCRIGGDEFCMVIDGGALLTAHEITDSIERLFERSAGSGPARSISCGVAFADASVSSRSELLRTADENQYQTKRARKESQRTEMQSTDQAHPHDRRALRD